MSRLCFRVIDFETTGEKSEEHPAAIIEYGFQDVWFDAETKAFAFGERGGGFVQSSIPVDIEARAVHHITDAEISSGAPLEHALLMLGKGKPNYFVAHNAAFEQQFYTGGEALWICTYKCALRAWPDAPRHSNQVLRYWRRLVIDADLAHPPHRAMPDAYVTAHLFMDMASDLLSRGQTIDDMVKVSASPPMPKFVSFGKPRGQEWASVPANYLKWLVDSSEMDKDVKWLAKKHLRLRDKAAAEVSFGKGG